MPRGRTAFYLRPKGYNVAWTDCGDPRSALQHLKRRQAAHRYYNPHLSCPEARLALIEWMESLCVMLQFAPVTFHTAVAILDVVLAKGDVETDKLKLLAYVSVSLAGKMEEPGPKLPSLADVSRLFQSAYDVADLIACEPTCLCDTFCA